MEEWKDIVICKDGKTYDFTGLYMVSNTGKVYSYKKGSTLKLSRKDNGYFQVGLYKDGEHYVFSVHRLVATMFIPNPNMFPVVNHKDENKQNNHVDNLEWCTQHYNVHYGTGIERMRATRTGQKTTEEQREKIAEANKIKVRCIETNEIFPSIEEASVWCGLKSFSKIGECCKGKRKTAGGYHWEYVNKID